MVSIVIPVKNEGVHILNTVNNPAVSQRTPYEIIVIDDHSDDGCANRSSLRRGRSTHAHRTNGLGLAGPKSGRTCPGGYPAFL